MDNRAYRGVLSGVVIVSDVLLHLRLHSAFQGFAGYHHRLCVLPRRVRLFREPHHPSHLVRSRRPGASAAALGAALRVLLSGARLGGVLAPFRHRGPPQRRPEARRASCRVERDEIVRQLCGEEYARLSGERGGEKRWRWTAVGFSRVEHKEEVGVGQWWIIAVEIGRIGSESWH